MISACQLQKSASPEGAINSARTPRKGLFGARSFAAPEHDPAQEELRAREDRIDQCFQDTSLFPLQPNLRAGIVGGRCEQEADRVGDKVMRLAEPCPKCQVESWEDKIRVEPIAAQIMHLKQDEIEYASQIKQDGEKTSHRCHCLESEIRSLRGGGQPLPESVRAYFEQRFGHNFGLVRVHTDKKATRIAGAVNAQAFTLGQDIAFGADQYKPETASGKKLLAHELTHVVQQGYKGQPHPFSQAAPFQSNLSIIRTPVEMLQTSPAPAHGNPTGGIIINIDSLPAQIDSSKTVDQITHDFYRIPIELLPPREPIPYGPLLTIGRYGCPLRRYGLASDNFSISYRLDDSDVRQRSRPSISGSLVECWAWRVRFSLRLRQTIFLPNDLATHPCLEGEDPAQKRSEILEHECLHEFDNNAAAVEVSRRLRERLTFLPGIGRLGAMARVTDDPDAFADECRERLQNSLEEVRDEHEMLYYRQSTQMAIGRDPHDEALHNLRLRLLEEARARR